MTDNDLPYNRSLDALESLLAGVKRPGANMLSRKRVGQPQDLDALIVLLASSQSQFIDGAVIAADDGFGA